MGKFFSDKQKERKLSEKYYNYIENKYDDAVRKGILQPTDASNSTYNLFYEGRGLKKFKGKFNLSQYSKAGLII